MSDIMSDAELEQMIISIIKTENDYLMRRIYGCIKKEIDNLKNDLLKGDKK